MNSFTIETWDDEGDKCILYTVKWLDSDYSETDKFFLKSKKYVELKEYFQELAKFLSQIIADEDGALTDYFRDEREAEGLPPKKVVKKENVTFFCINYPLRLYCLRINEQIVVLFNGDEKTSDVAQDGKTSMTFYEAQGFATRIKKAYDKREFEFGQTDEIIIY
jgi:hypothetical protein